MDNNYYERRVREPVRTEKPKNFMGKVIAIQLLLSLLVTGLLFAVCRTDTALSGGLKEFYGRLSANDMSASEIVGTFKKVAEFTFAPSSKWDGTFSSDEESQTQTAGETTEQTGEKATFSPVYLTAKFIPPVESGRITSRFGYRISPVTNKYSLHTGVDIAVPESTKIRASYGGVAEKAEFNDVRGNYIVINHGGNIKTTYNHCSRLLVREGMRLRAGETVALSGSTGASTGPHLHFEITLNGKYINPLWAVSNEL